MTQPFPLYDQLAQVTADANWDLRRICMTINTLPDEHMELLYALILHHALLNPKANLQTLPFAGKLPDGRKGIIYTGNHLPLPLQGILSAYLRVSLGEITL